MAEHTRELSRLRHELDQQREMLHALQHETGRIDAELQDARWLTLIGGPRRRWRGGGVGCDGGLYLPGSNGEAAHRALRASGYCDATTLPMPVARK